MGSYPGCTRAQHLTYFGAVSCTVHERFTSGTLLDSTPSAIDCCYC